MLDHPNYICTDKDLDRNKSLLSNYICEKLRSVRLSKGYVIWNPYSYSLTFTEKERMLNTVKSLFGTVCLDHKFRTVKEVRQSPEVAPSIQQMDDWFYDIDEADYIIVLDQNWLIDLLVCYAKHVNKPIFMMTKQNYRKVGAYGG